MIAYRRTNEGWAALDKSEVSNKIAKELEALYDLHRPDVSEEAYELIAMNVEDGSGILNCRVNGEHVQIRF
jgi:hypothetical protein